MASSPVRFHEAAAAEYEAAVNWYFERSQLAASKFASELSRAIEKIAEAPDRWPAYILNTRRYLLYRFPYAVVYRKLPSSTIQILAVAHTRRRPGYWKKRMAGDQ